MKTCRYVLAAAGLACQPLPAAELDPIVVTATRTARTADESLAPVTVLTREDIERLQARSVPELLRGLPGLSLVNSGGAGKATAVFLRGTESDHVLVLIDGVKVGSATLGTTAFQHLPIEQIERIEIVRGPRSSLYGSEAIGGVIQIFTRKGGGPVRPFASAGGGSYKSWDAAAGLSGGGERGWFNLAVSGSETEGFNACEGKPAPGGAGCFTVEPDKDGYRNRAASVRGGYRFRNSLEIDVHALRSEGDTEYDGSFVNESESVQQVLGGGLRFNLAGFWDLSVSGGRSLDQSENFKDGVFRSRFDTQRDTVSFQNDFGLGGVHLLSLGFDYQDDRVDSTTPYRPDSRNNRGAFAQYQGGLGRHSLQLSLRRDDNQQFGEYTTGTAAWGWNFWRRLRLNAAYGTAFKAPTFNELYFPGFGNPDLRPEQSRSLELGLKGNHAHGRWSLNVYETRVEDLIAFDAATFAPGNIDQALIRGLELVAAVHWRDWELDTNLSLLDPRNRSGGANHKRLLPRRPQSAFRLDLDRRLGDLRLGGSVVAEGERYDDLANTRRLAGYATVELRGEYRFSRAWRLQARVENLLDKEYETAAYYNQPGRSLFVTLRYQP